MVGFFMGCWGGEMGGLEWWSLVCFLVFLRLWIWCGVCCWEMEHGEIYISIPAQTHPLSLFTVSLSLVPIAKAPPQKKEKKRILRHLLPPRHNLFIPPQLLSTPLHSTIQTRLNPRRNFLHRSFHPYQSNKFSHFASLDPNSILVAHIRIWIDCCCCCCCCCGIRQHILLLITIIIIISIVTR